MQRRIGLYKSSWRRLVEMWIMSVFRRRYLHIWEMETDCGIKDMTAAANVWKMVTGCLIPD